MRVLFHFMEQLADTKQNYITSREFSSFYDVMTGLKHLPPDSDATLFVDLDGVFNDSTIFGEFPLLALKESRIEVFRQFLSGHKNVNVVIVTSRHIGAYRWDFGSWIKRTTSMLQVGSDLKPLIVPQTDRMAVSEFLSKESIPRRLLLSDAVKDFKTALFVALAYPFDRLFHQINLRDHKKLEYVLAPIIYHAPGNVIVIDEGNEMKSKVQKAMNILKHFDYTKGIDYWNINITALKIKAFLFTALTAAASFSVSRWIMEKRRLHK